MPGVTMLRATFNVLSLPILLPLVLVNLAREAPIYGMCAVRTRTGIAAGNRLSKRAPRQERYAARLASLASMPT